MPGGLLLTPHNHCQVTECCAMGHVLWPEGDSRDATQGWKRKEFK